MTRICLVIGLFLGVCLVCNGDPVAPPQQPPSEQIEDLALAALWSAVDILWHETEHSRIIEVLEAVLSLDPTNLEAYTSAAWLLWSQGREDEAVAMYTRATEALPGNYEPWFEFGMYYRHHRKDNEKAKELYLKAMECEPHPNTVERQLALTYEDLGQIAEALKLWQNLAERFPEDGAIQFNLNRLRQKYGL